MNKNFKGWLIYTVSITIFGLGIISLVMAICESLGTLTVTDRNEIYFLAIVIGAIVSSFSYWL